VTFQAVQREAGVSQNFLYKNPELRAWIEHQRRTPPSTPTGAGPGRRRNNIAMAHTSEIARLKKQHRQEVAELRKSVGAGARRDPDPAA
jgi:hypothetical protein